MFMGQLHWVGCPGYYYLGGGVEIIAGCRER